MSRAVRHPPFLCNGLIVHFSGCFGQSSCCFHEPGGSAGAALSRPGVGRLGSHVQVDVSADDCTPSWLRIKQIGFAVLSGYCVRTACPYSDDVLISNHRRTSFRRVGGENTPDVLDAEDILTSSQMDIRIFGCPSGSRLQETFQEAFIPCITGFTYPPPAGVAKGLTLTRLRRQMEQVDLRKSVQSRLEYWLSIGCWSLAGR